jgi:hypothetical protein
MTATEHITAAALGDTTGRACAECGETIRGFDYVEPTTGVIDAVYLTGCACSAAAGIRGSYVEPDTLIHVTTAGRCVRQ